MENSNQFVSAKNVLRYCVDIGQKANPVGKNAAYLIYQNLLDELDQYRDLEEFVETHADLNKTALEILAHVSANYQKLVSADVSERVAKLRTNGLYLQDKLPGRFVMQKTPNPELTKEQNTLIWFNENCNLNPETDSNLVQAGFFAMFC